MTFRTMIVALLMALVCACTYTPTTSLAYRPISIETKPRLQPRLIVKPLSEARPARSYPNEFGAGFKTYIPLLPYLRIPYERLDETSLLHEQRKQERNHGLDRTTEPFTTAIARAIADDLRSSGLFEEVLFSPAAHAESGDAYVLEGDLKSTEFDMFATSVSDRLAASLPA